MALHLAKLNSRYRRTKQLTMNKNSKVMLRTCQNSKSALEFKCLNSQLTSAMYYLVTPLNT